MAELNIYCPIFDGSLIWAFSARTIIFFALLLIRHYQISIKINQEVVAIISVALPCDADRFNWFNASTVRLFVKVKSFNSDFMCGDSNGSLLCLGVVVVVR